MKKSRTNRWLNIISNNRNFYNEAIYSLGSQAHSEENLANKALEIYDILCRGKQTLIKL